MKTNEIAHMLHQHFPMIAEAEFADALERALQADVEELALPVARMALAEVIGERLTEDDEDWFELAVLRFADALRLHRGR